MIIWVNALPLVTKQTMTDAGTDVSTTCADDDEFCTQPAYLLAVYCLAEIIVNIIYLTFLFLFSFQTNRI